MKLRSEVEKPRASFDLAGIAFAAWAASALCYVASKIARIDGMDHAALSSMFFFAGMQAGAVICSKKRAKGGE